MAMADEGATLGDKALRQIAIGLRDIRRLKKDDRSSSTSGNARQENYQVKWDVDIDAATNSVTTPGLGTATIWARVSGGDLYNTGRVLDVVNRSESSSYTAGDWGKVERINGEWQPYTGTGGTGGGHTIWFTITDVLCPETDYVSETTLVVTATYYNQSCTGTPPGANYEGTYDVYDMCNHTSGLTPGDMLGTTGRATYMYPLTGTCTPKWIIDELCAQPECA
jgi:hypothetical protein